MGGLPRRATVIKSLKAEQGGPVFVVDAGDLTWKSARLSSDRLAQQREKALLLFEAMNLDGFDAMVPGDGDLALGPAWLQEVATSGVAPPLVASNLECGGTHPFPRFRVADRQGVKVGFVGILPEGLSAGDCVATAPVPALEQALAAPEAQGIDLLVLLSQQEPTADKALAEAVSRIDLVVNGGVGAQYSRPRALPGEALQLGAGSRGKKLGVASIVLQPGARGFMEEDARSEVARDVERNQQRVDMARTRLEKATDEAAKERARGQLEHFEGKLAEAQQELATVTEGPAPKTHTLENRLVPLGEDVADDPEVLALVEARKDRIAAAASLQVPSEAFVSPFVGSASCAGCHAGPTAQWKATAHARAWATLQAENRDQDLACFSCHVTGAVSEDGPQHPSQVKGLEDVGCESCHGAGREHAANPTGVDMVASPGEAVCTQCHDGDQDGGRFELDEYLPKVRHGAGG